jgi:hypothetical protein
MALTRRATNRVSSAIWPGFVDAMTALLLVLMFVLTIFMIVQFVLRETISGQETELDALAAEVNSLALALGLEQQSVAALEDQRPALSATLDEAGVTAEQQSALIAALQGQVADQEKRTRARAAQITSFEAQVASLLAERDDARAEAGALEVERDRLVSEQEALQLAVARAREEIDAQTEAARLAAARRDALQALIADLRNRVSDRETSLADALASLQAAEVEAAEATERASAVEEARLARPRRRRGTASPARGCRRGPDRGGTGATGGGRRSGSLRQRLAERGRRTDRDDAGARGAASTGGRNADAARCGPNGGRGPDGTARVRARRAGGRCCGTRRRARGTGCPARRRSQ